MVLREITEARSIHEDVAATGAPLLIREHETGRF